MRKTLGALAVGLGLTAPPALAEELRIGFMATLTGPSAVLGQHLRDGFMLGIDHAGGKLGGVDTKVFIADDQLKPDVAVQEVEGLLKRDDVHIVAGVVFSNVLMAIYKPVTDSNAILISANAGPSPVAGERCSPNFFATSWQNDQAHGAMGKHVQDSGIKRVFLLAPNYQAGKDGLTGFKRYFKGEVVDEVYTRLGQEDFSAEIARIQSARPEAVYTFMPGGMGIALLKQWDQAGMKNRIPLFSAFTVDETTLPAVQDAALGLFSTSIYAIDLDTPANKTFAADFRKKFGYVPSYYAAQAYDAARMIDAAVRRTGGGVSDRDKLRAALGQAKFDSVRGEFKLNRNHFPINDFYLVKADRLPDGGFGMVKQTLVFDDYADDYAEACKMSR